MGKAIFKVGLLCDGRISPFSFYNRLQNQGRQIDCTRLDAEFS
jgi:hypothetical protein